MASYLGIRDTLQWAGTNERPEDWFNVLQIIDPNGDSPFTAFLGQIAAEPVNSEIFHWWEKSYGAYRVFANGGISSSATSIILETTAGGSVDAAQYVRNGFILEHEDSGEQILVTGQSFSGAVGISRNFNGVGAATIDDQDALTILSNVHETKSDFPSGIQTPVTEKYNYTQIFKMSLEASRTELQTSLRWGNKYDELKRESLQMLARQVEMAALFQGRVAPAVGPGGGVIKATGGLFSGYKGTPTYLDSGNVNAVGGLQSKSAFNTFLQALFAFGSKRRIVYAGGTWMKFFQEFCGSSLIRMADNGLVRTFGQDITEYTCHWGTIYALVHPLLTRHSDWTKNALFVDPENPAGQMKRRVMQPLKFQRNVQGRGEDLRRDGWIGEFGFQWPAAIAHGIQTGVTGFQG